MADIIFGTFFIVGILILFYIFNKLISTTRKQLLNDKD